MDSPKPKHIIITGAPGTGKSTLLKGLEKKGYIVYPEVARQVIIESQDQGSDVVPWKDLEAFTEKVLSKRIIDFEKADPKKTCFFDRGLPDSLAYIYWANKKALPHWIDWCEQFKGYSEVIICPPWKKIYATDSQRIESFEESIEIHEMMKRAYQQFNYSLTTLPLTTVEERITFIEEHFFNGQST